MATRTVNPNRMELLNLKRELAIARRGHKMLKDKRDELMRRFLTYIDENERLRREVDKRLRVAMRGLTLAGAVMHPAVLEESLLLGGEPLRATGSVRRIMGVDVPVLSLPEVAVEGRRLPYGYAGTSPELDAAVEDLVEALPGMLQLAEVEKTVQLLAAEIERTRRRVNSLEHVKIPELEALIRSITLKMEENERGNLTRLMKVKDQIVAREIMERRRRNEELGAKQPDNRVATAGANGGA